LGIVLFCLGFPNQSKAHSDAVIAAARGLTDPTSFADSLAIITRLCLLMGDTTAVEEWAPQLIALATELGYTRWHAEGAVFLGWVTAKKGNVAEGISLLRSGIAADERGVGVVHMPHDITLLAAACGVARQFDEAMTLLDDALLRIERTGERYFLAEVYRQKGWLLLRQGHAETAEDLYRKALAIAREQEAKMWELRAAVSLARLRHDQGRPAEARDLLAPVYGWFTEGLDTPDLKDAKALLDELM
jgi:predicted ATPase